MLNTKTLTFRTPGREPLTGRVKNPSAKLGAVAAKVAARFGIAGTFECIGKQGEALDPETPLSDLPEEEITLASELTPA